MKFLKNLSLLAAGAILLTACSDDTPDTPDGDDVSTFEISISGFIDDNYAADGLDVTVQAVYMHGSALPEGEKILTWGCVSSVVDDEPTVETARAYLLEVEDDETFTSWDWSEDLYYRCATLDRMIPGVTYYVRGYVKTTRGEYYTSTVTTKAEWSAPGAGTKGEYEVPIVFNIFPLENGSEMPEEILDYLLDWANFTYENALALDGYVDTGVRFVLADLPGLDAPGRRYINEPVKYTYGVDEYDFLRPEWFTDITKAVNVWILPIGTPDDFDYYGDTIAGYTLSPFFYPGEELSSTNTYDSSEAPMYQHPGVFLNSRTLFGMRNEYVLAHELGHFLGLHHVFEPFEDCEDTPYYDRSVYLQYYDDLGYMRMLPDEIGRAHV